MKKAKTIVYIILISLFSVTFLVSAFVLGRYFLDARQQGHKYDDLASQVEQAMTETNLPKVTITIPQEEGEDPETAVILDRYAQLYLQNSDMVGWIRMDGTKINYPVMQTPTSREFYLKRNFDKEKNAHGCIFADELCNVNKPSDNVTLYGHHMKDGSMFAVLEKFQDREFWETHRTFHFDTVTELHTYEIFAAFVTTASRGEGFPYHRFITADDAEHFDRFVSQCKELSFYDTGITPEFGDKLVCLSTCDYTQVNGRFVVVGRRID